MSACSGSVDEIGVDARSRAEVLRRTSALEQIANVLGLPPAQVTAQVAAQVVEVLRAAADEARTRAELQSAAGIKHREHFRKTYTEPLVSAGWLEKTIPDKPTSRMEKYRPLVRP
jgi:hypothetical protein